MPPSLTWHTFPTPAAQAAALAEAVANCLRDCLHTQGHAVLAVSGGRSPIAFFEALSQAKLDWPNVTITLVDERLVPPQHADSNAVLEQAAATPSSERPISLLLHRANVHCQVYYAD